MSTLPIRVREIIGPNGSRTRSLHVFCPRDAASIAPERCARCHFRCPPEDATRAPAVGCAVESEGYIVPLTPNRSLLYGPDAAAARVPAGAASAQVVVCIDADASLEDLRLAIPSARSWLSYPVVDVNGVLLGTLSSGALFVVSQYAVDSLLPAGQRMLPFVAVRESDHLDDAIGVMALHHLRQVAIVDGERRVTGTLFDLDVLAWVARGAPARWW